MKDKSVLSLAKSTELSSGAKASSALNKDTCVDTATDKTLIAIAYILHHSTGRETNSSFKVFIQSFDNNISINFNFLGI